MNWILFYIFFIILLAVLIQQRRRMQQLINKQRMKKKFGKEISRMNELIKEYIGIEVIVCTGFSSVSGTLTKIENDWIEIQTGRGSEIINLEYISRIKEYPRNKKGKKSSISVFFLG